MFRTAILASLVLSVITLEGAHATSGPLFPGAQYAAGDRPESVAIADLNGDFAPDLAVANNYDDNVSVSLHQIPSLVASSVGDVVQFCSVAPWPCLAGRVNHFHLNSARGDGAICSGRFCSAHVMRRV